MAKLPGFRLPIVSYALQAFVSEPMKPVLDTVVLAPPTGVYVSRSDKGELAQGYARDFITQTLPDILTDCAAAGIRVISNAGGVNPIACGQAIEALIAELGIDLKVAVVTGDDLIDRAADFADVTEMFSGAPFPAAPISINAYLGAAPVAAALDQGADIVVTDHSVDSALVLGACIHEFGWAFDELDRLAGASLAGHILECGAQATGGLFTDWEQVPGWHDIGYPIAQIDADGSFTVTKPDGSGGLVSVGTIAEQMLYEIGDPQSYLLPDVTCDFSGVAIKQVGPDQVRVSGARGHAPPESYKVSATYQDGYRLGLTLTICGIDADRKARRTGETVLRRVAAMLDARGEAPFDETSVEILGAEASYGPHARVASPREVILKIAAKHRHAAPLTLMLREATSTGTSMSPGTTGMGGNRPKPMPLVRLFSCLLPKAAVMRRVHMAGCVSHVAETAPDTGADRARAVTPAPATLADAVPVDDMIEIPMVRLAWAAAATRATRATAPISASSRATRLTCRGSGAELTESAVSAYFGHLVQGPVRRFDVPGIHAVIS